MTVAGDVVVLEDWLEVDALVLNSCFVLFKDHVNLLFILATSEILATGKKGVTRSNGSNSRGWVFVNTNNCECFVDIGAEIDVSEESLGVSSLVLLGEGFELVSSEGEVHAGENLFELGACNTSLSQLIKITEELFNSDTLHHNYCLKTVFYIIRII